MKNLEVIETFQSLFKREISNFFICSENEILVWLEDGTKVKITTKNIVKNLKEQNIESITSENDYVLNHDYGYNQEHELAELKRLKLRNIIDLKDYLIQAVEDMFYAEFNCWIVKFLNNKLKTKIFIEEIN